MRSDLSARASAVAVAAVLWLAPHAWAAQGTVDSAHSAFTIASTSLTTVSLTNTSAGDAVLVMVFKNSTANRTHTVTDDLGNDSIAIRHMTYLCLSWDHRALDGALAAQFLSALRKKLEAWPIS